MIFVYRLDRGNNHYRIYKTLHGTGRKPGRNRRKNLPGLLYPRLSFFDNGYPDGNLRKRHLFGRQAKAVRGYSGYNLHSVFYAGGTLYRPRPQPAASFEKQFRGWLS